MRRWELRIFDGERKNNDDINKERNKQRTKLRLHGMHGRDLGSKTAVCWWRFGVWGEGSLFQGEGDGCSDSEESCGGRRDDIGQPKTALTEDAVAQSTFLGNLVPEKVVLNSVPDPHGDWLLVRQKNRKSGAQKYSFPYSVPVYGLFLIML
ncbi:hypothetical protein VNO78_11073 [Psophocarpus tetragonolobus]|uniref:Uncharacterized protein n=1 Tax=Psophocarpus tetragonolobus TaxID=3891 RepID=A0AAN9XNA6_PSOTE